MEARYTIELGEPTSSSRSPQMASFEEAFGEYSNLGGKGRARRAKRKAKRTARRTDRRQAKVTKKKEKFATKDAIKRAKIETRQQRRSDKKTDRQDARIQRRSSRKEQRNTLKANQQAARMARKLDRQEKRNLAKMERAEQRQSRKDLKTEREAERELQAQQDRQNLDEGYDEVGYDDGGYDDGGYDDGGYEEAGVYDEYEDYGDGDYNYDEDYGDDGYYDSWGTSMFDGEENVEFEDDSYNDDFSNENQSNMDAMVKPAQELADKIEWNRKFIDKLKDSKLNSKPNTIEIDKQIVLRDGRIKELKCKVRDYVCFCGDYKSDFSSANGRQSPSARQIRKRMKLASIAKMRAKRKAGFLKRRRNKTVVSASLNPTITSNQIRIPSSGIDGLPANTGLIATDDINDYGYGGALDVHLGADGSTSKISAKNVLIGIGIAAITIYGLKKANVFK
tara:strand:+ start:7201 stop:8550 length:1350 start_codon:yes stop_codon:yes gene_type:complete